VTEFEIEAIRLLTAIDERLKQDNEVIAAELAQIRKLLMPPTHKAPTKLRLYRLVVAGVVVALIISISLSFFPQLAWKP
jgi:hypothetical protein